jgi:predicted dehydrogenase
MSQELGFGVVGAWLIAPFHLKAIQHATGGRAVAVCDIAEERVRSVAAEFGIRGHTDLDALLNDESIDVLCVATPNHLHRDIVIRAAGAGKHVLTEKPPAMSLKEVDEMIAACEAAGVKFGCIVQCRIRKSIQAIKNAIEGGRFGKVLHVDAYMKWFRPRDYYTSDGWRGRKKSGSGVTVAQGFHYIDLVQYLAGPAVRVEAKMENIGHPGIHLEDDVLAHIHYASGARSIVQLSTAIWPGTDVRIEVNGEWGTAVMVGETIETWAFKDEKPEDDAIRREGDASQATGAGGAADFGYADHQVVIQDMIDCIGSDRDVVTPVRSVRPSLEIVLAMYQSAARGTAIELPVADDESALA